MKEYSAISPQSSWVVKVAAPPFQLDAQVQISHCGTVVLVSSAFVVQAVVSVVVHLHLDGVGLAGVIGGAESSVSTVVASPWSGYLVPSIHTSAVPSALTVALRSAPYLFQSLVVTRKPNLSYLPSKLSTATLPQQSVPVKAWCLASMLPPFTSVPHTYTPRLSEALDGL